jgi:hypothetical protein
MPGPRTECGPRGGCTAGPRPAPQFGHRLATSIFQARAQRARVAPCGGVGWGCAHAHSGPGGNHTPEHGTPDIGTSAASGWGGSGQRALARPRRPGPLLSPPTPGRTPREVGNGLLLGLRISAHGRARGLPVPGARDSAVRESGGRETETEPEWQQSVLLLEENESCEHGVPLRAVGLTGRAWTACALLYYSSIDGGAYQRLGQPCGVEKYQRGGHLLCSPEQVHVTTTPFKINRRI